MKTCGILVQQTSSVEREEWLRRSVHQLMSRIPKTQIVSVETERRLSDQVSGRSQDHLHGRQRHGYSEGEPDRLSAALGGVDYIVNLSLLPACVISQRFTKPVIELQYYGRNVTRSGCDIGLVENGNHEAVIEVCGVLSDGDATRTLVKAGFSVHWMAKRCQRYVLGAVGELLAKCINRFERHEWLEPHIDPYARSVRCSDRARYWVRYAASMAKRAKAAALARTLHAPSERWAICHGQGEAMSGVSSLAPLALPAGEFWADPFIIRHGGETWLFFERFEFREGKGVIACGRICNSAIVDVRDVLVARQHLSFPNVFWESGEIFMIPECSEGGGLTIYRCTQFPDQWEVYATGFQGARLVDTVHFKDVRDESWLLTTLVDSYARDSCDMLHAFRIDSLKLREITPHCDNPVVVDARSARNAGHVFRVHNRLFRCSQDNSYGFYGHGLNVLEIRHLSIDRYEEVPVAHFGPEVFIPEALGIHHLCQGADEFVVDMRY